MKKHFLGDGPALVTRVTKVTRLEGQVSPTFTLPTPLHMSVSCAALVASLTLIKLVYLSVMVPRNK